MSTAAYLLLACVSALGAVACGKSSSGSGDSSGNGGAGSSSAVSPPEGPKQEAVSPQAVPGDEDCPGWTVGQRPSAELPTTHGNEYVVELERWNVSNQSRDPAATRAGIHDAIAWAQAQGYDKIVLPEGTYLVGEETTDNYAAGIELPSNVTFELADGAVLAMAPNDRWNYCVVTAADNVTIRGGEIRGDRDDHDYGNAQSEGHDEGHGICVWTAIDRVLVENMNIHSLTGDGVLILGRAASDTNAEAATTNVTIRNSAIHHNRRQGVSIVGGHRIVIENNSIHHIEGTSPQFGIDIEGAGRSDQDILIRGNRFHHNAGGDFVTSTGHNVWLEENTMSQCQVDEDGNYDAALPCELETQSDGPIVLWKETDTVVLNNVVHLTLPTANGRYGLIGYTSGDGPTRDNPVGNYIAGNTFYGGGMHLSNNLRQAIVRNTLYEGIVLGHNLGCTRLEENHINRTASENYKLRNVAGEATGNVLNRAEGFPASADEAMLFPMANDAPYRNSSPVFW